MCLDRRIRFKCSQSLYIIPIKSLEVKEVKTFYMHTQNQSTWIYEHIYILITSNCNIFYHHMAHAVATCWLQYLNNLSFRSWLFYIMESSGFWMPFWTSTLKLLDMFRSFKILQRCFTFSPFSIMNRTNYTCICTIKQSKEEQQMVQMKIGIAQFCE